MKSKKVLRIVLPAVVVLFLVAAFTYNYKQQPAAKAASIPLEDFFKNPEQTNFQISPDGNYISYLAPYQNRLNVHVKKIGTDKVVRVTSDLNRDIRTYFWKAN